MDTQKMYISNPRCGDVLEGQSMSATALVSCLVVYTPPLRSARQITTNCSSMRSRTFHEQKEIKPGLACTFRMYYFRGLNTRYDGPTLFMTKCCKKDATQTQPTQHVTPSNPAEFPS